MKSTNPVLGSKVGTELILKVVIKFIIFFNESNFFGVCECEDDNGNIFVATGKFPLNLYVGQSYEFQGKVVFQRGAQQLAVESYKSIMPFDRNSTISYLASLPNIKSKAVLLYQAYGKDSIQILKTDPERVAKEIKGIGIITAKKCQNALLLMNISEASILKLLECGLTPLAARSLYDLYGDKIIDKINTNPYFLLRDVKGYGFKKCDAIAEHVGYKFNGKDRIKAGIEYTLETAQQEGHCYLPKDELIQKTCDILSRKLSVQTMAYLLKNKQTSYVYNNQKFDIDLVKLDEAYKKETGTRHYGIDYRYRIQEVHPDEVDNLLSQLVSESRIIIVDNKVYLPLIYKAERYSEAKILKMASIAEFVPRDITDVINKIEFRNKVIFEPEQAYAIETFASYKGGVFLLSGSAGCGKTFTVKSLLEVEKILNPRLKFFLFAPTGKAAKVMQSSSGYECKTIHRGLEYTPDGGFLKNEKDPLDADLIIVDETSMLDIELLYHLLCAVKEKTKLIFLGDVNQLQSVGCGNVLNDFVKSAAVLTVELKTIKRQSEKSGIIVNANRIIKNEPLLDHFPDFMLSVSEDNDFLMNGLLEEYMDLLNDGVSIDDIQVLTPQKNNTFGTYALNHKLQEMINPDNSNELPYKTVGDITLAFRVGDKVIHTKNNYDKKWYQRSGDDYVWTNNCGIFNGDCGTVYDIYLNPVTKKKEMIVKYDDKYIFYANDDFETVELAYALTIHKSQGSEWPYVLIPLLKQHYAMLNKHLFYTAVTRGKVIDFVFANELAIKTAMNKSTLQERYTSFDI